MATLILQQAYRLYKPPCSGKRNPFTSGKIKLRNLEHQHTLPLVVKYFRRISLLNHYVKAYRK